MEQALEPLSSDRARIERIVMRLHETDDTTERADLGSALVRAVARYEDTLERSVVPRPRGVVQDDELERQATCRHALRDAMTVSERPHPPKTRFGRFVANTHVKLDHTLEDVATPPTTPGTEVIDGPEDE